MRARARRVFAEDCRVKSGLREGRCLLADGNLGELDLILRQCSELASVVGFVWVCFFEGDVRYFLVKLCEKWICAGFGLSGFGFVLHNS